MAAKKAEEEAEKTGVPAPEMAPADERPAAEIVDEIMRSMPRSSGTESTRHRGPRLEIRRREVEPNPVVEWFKKLFKGKPKE